MAAVNDSAVGASSSGFSDWVLQAIIGIGVLMLFTGVWLYTHFSEGPAEPTRPRPIWLGVAKVTAQTADGRMIDVKVNLNLDKEDAVGELDPHQPAFKALIQDVGGRTPHEHIVGREGMQRFGQLIRDRLNTYLDERQLDGRIKGVAFEELMLLQ